MDFLSPEEYTQALEALDELDELYKSNVHTEQDKAVWFENIENALVGLESNDPQGADEKQDNSQPRPSTGKQLWEHNAMYGVPSAGQSDDPVLENMRLYTQPAQSTPKRKRSLDEPVAPRKRFRSTADGYVHQSIEQPPEGIQQVDTPQDTRSELAIDSNGSATGEPEGGIDAPIVPVTPIKQPRAWKLRHHVSDTVNLPDGIEFTMMEMCIFFPKCFSRPKLMDRAIRNGFDPITLAEMTMSGFADYSWKDIKDATERYKQHKKAGLHLLYGNSKQATAIAQGPQNDMTATNLALKSMYTQGTLRTKKEHMLLRDIYDSVDIFPVDNDCGVWTACLMFWKETEVAHPNATTADVPRFKEILENDGALPTLTTNGYANHDMETLARFGRRSQANVSRPKPS